MKKKIYFAGSIRGGRSDREVYGTLIRHLSQYGKVLTEHVGDPGISGNGEQSLTDDRIYHRDLSWIRQSDVVVAEISTPSIGVGYEIGIAEQMNKPILCLCRDSAGTKLSAMIAGNPDVNIGRYKTVQDAVKLIDTFFTSME